MSFIQTLNQSATPTATVAKTTTVETVTPVLGPAAQAPVMPTTEKQTITIQKLEMKSGIELVRGYDLISVRARRNLSDLWKNWQIGDLIEVATEKERATISNGMRYHGMKAATKKQANGMIKIQRIA